MIGDPPIPAPPSDNEIVIAPLEPVAISILSPAIKYEEPSVSLVKEPDIPQPASNAPLVYTSPPKTAVPNVLFFKAPLLPETKKKTSAPD